jgi:hypothetical protein
MKKLKINSDDLLAKMDSIFKMLDNIETLKDTDIDLLKEEASKIAKEIEEEYSDHLDSKE